jgi:hypothetical protein
MPQAYRRNWKELKGGTHHANLRKNGCDFRCCWRNRDQQHGPSRSVVRLIIITTTTIIATTAIITATTIIATMPTILATMATGAGGVVTDPGWTLRPPQRAAFFFFGGWIIALPTSDGGSITLTVSRYLRQSASPRPASIISPPNAALAYPRNRRTPAFARCDPSRQSRQRKSLQRTILPCDRLETDDGQHRYHQSEIRNFFLDLENVQPLFSAPVLVLTRARPPETRKQLNAQQRRRRKRLMPQHGGNTAASCFPATNKAAASCFRCASA